MASIASWQREAVDYPGFAADPDRLATNFFELSVQIFLFLLGKHEKDHDLDSYLQQIRHQAQRYSLWGSNFDAREGGLDEKLTGADRLKETLLPILSEMAETLASLGRIVDKKLVLRDVYDIVQMLSEQNEALFRRVPEDDIEEDDIEADARELSRMSLDDVRSEKSEGSGTEEPTEIENLIQDVENYNDCLFGLGSVLANPAEAVVVESSLRSQPDVHNALSTNVAWPYIASVIEAFPSIDNDFARRLGQANRERYERLRLQREFHAKSSPQLEIETSAELTATDSEIEGLSEYPDSTVASTELSSAFDKPHQQVSSKGNQVIKRAPSVTTFASSSMGMENERRTRGIPRMPEDQPWGEPFDCTVCGETLTNVWSTAEWKKHVHRDLEPYICTFSDCNLGLQTFAFKHHWAAHEVQEHQNDRTSICNECGKRSSTYAEFMDHCQREHPNHQHRCDALLAQDDLCPFCQTRPHTSRAKFVSHVGRHMQEISHAAIPMSAMLENDQEVDEGTDDSSQNFESIETADTKKSQFDEGASTIQGQPSGTKTPKANPLDSLHRGGAPVRGVYKNTYQLPPAGF